MGIPISTDGGKGGVLTVDTSIQNSDNDAFTFAVQTGGGARTIPNAIGANPGWASIGEDFLNGFAHDQTYTIHLGNLFCFQRRHYHGHTIKRMLVGVGNFDIAAQGAVYAVDKGGLYALQVVDISLGGCIIL